MSSLTAEQSIYAEVATEAHTNFSEVVRLAALAGSEQPAFRARYAALSLRIAIEALAFAAIAPNKAVYERVRGEKLATDWHAKRIFKALESKNKDFFPLALTGPTKTKDDAWHYGRHSSEPFTKNDAETAYDDVSEVLHATNPWGDAESKIDARFLSDIAHKGMTLLNLHAAFIRTDTFKGCWIVSRQPKGDWRFLTAKANGDFMIDH